MAFALFGLVGGAPAWATVHPTPSPTPRGLNDTTVGIRTSGAHHPDNRGNFHYEIAPGGARIDYVAISNYSFHPVTLRLLGADVTSISSDDFVPVGGKPHGAGAWIIPEESVVHIPKTSMQIVPFQITVPRTAMPGDHDAAIMVSLLVQQPAAHGRAVIVDHRIGLRIYLRVPGSLHPELAIVHLRSHFEGGWTAWGYGHMVTDFDVVNVGNVAVSAKQALRYSRWLWLGDVSVHLSPLPTILPGGFIHVHARGRGMWAAADVTTHVTETPTGFPSGVGMAIATARVSQFVIPWAWLVLALVLYLTWRLCRRWRKRRQDKAAAAAAAAEAAAEAERAAIAAAAVEAERRAVAEAAATSSGGKRAAKPKGLRRYLTQAPKPPARRPIERSEDPEDNA